MRVLIVGNGVGGFRRQVGDVPGLEIVEREPDVIIAYGGDGTFIGAERTHPGIPKVGVRREESTLKCDAHQNSAVLGRLAGGELDETELIKLEARFDGRDTSAVNDVIIRNTDPRSAVRLRVELNGQPVTEELIADGIVVCTPFGSSAYFRSITRTMIRTGIGVAFNNCTDLLNHLVVGEDEVLEVRLARGPATLAADNDPKTFALEDGQSVTIRRAPTPFRVLGVETLRCADCRYVHAPRRRY